MTISHIYTNIHAHIYKLFSAIVRLLKIQFMKDENYFNTTYVKVKVKRSRYRPGVAQRVGRGIVLLSMTAALEGDEWSAARPGRNLPPGKTRYPFFTGGRVGPRAGLDGRKIFFYMHLFGSSAYRIIYLGLLIHSSILYIYYKHNILNTCICRRWVAKLINIKLKTLF